MSKVKVEAAGVTVCVRIRPRNAAEVAADMAVVIKTVRIISSNLTSYLVCLITCA